MSARGAAAPYDFDLATGVQPEPDGSFSGCIVDGWDIGGNANGGYLLAIAAQGLRVVAARPDPVTVTAHYLAPGTFGPVSVRGEVVKRGRRFTTVTGSLERDGRPMLQVLAAFGEVTEAGSDDAVEHLAHGAPDLPPPEECVMRSPTNGTVPVGLMRNVSVALHPDDAGFSDERRSGDGVMRGWFAFADGRPLDTLGLLLAADSFPPAVFNLDLPPGWVPTVELTVHVRGVPAPGPVRCRFTTRFVQSGAFEEDGEVWDSAGRLVAISRQYALLARG